MKIIITENQYSFLKEALNPSEFRKFMSIGRELALTRIGEIWSKLEAQCDSKNRNGDRLYFKIKQDLDDKSFDLPIRKELEDYLDSNNLNVISFKSGTVQKKSGGNIFSLGKALTILSKKDKNALDILQQYNNQKSNVALTEDLIMVISKSPYDLAGMSTNRAWKSCMNLRGDNKNGENVEYIEVDVSNGTLISYLIEAKDLNIQNPIGRILIKPYLKNNNEKDVLYGIEQNSVKYGRDNVDYIKLLLHILDTSQNEKTGVFKIDEKLYSDGSKSIVKLDSKKDYDIKDLCEFYGIENYTINPDGLVDVDGGVDLNKFTLKKLPFKFGKVTGHFDCSNNNLTSLQGAPTSVGGGFICSNNNLTSLQGAPTSVVGSFFCTENNLTSLQGAPTSVGGSFYCSNNNLTSLQGAPTSVGVFFICSNNNLTSLQGAPTSVGRNFYCKNQKNGKKFTEQDVKGVCKVKGNVYV